MKAWMLRRRRVPLWAAILGIAMVSLLVTRALFWISPLETYVFRSLVEWSHGLVLLLNWLPVFLCMLLFYFLTNNLSAAIAPVALAALALATVNRVKLTLRGDPLLHWDFALAGELLGVAKGLDGVPIGPAIAGVLAFICLAIGLGLLFRNTRMPWRTRLLGVLATACAILLANATLYSRADIEKNLPVWGSFYNMADVHTSRGNLYELIYGWNTSRSGTPEGYDEQATRAFADAYAAALSPTLPDTLPSIVMVMGEAFSDLSGLAAFDFTGHRDPLLGYKALLAEGIGGHLVVPSQGGGTADTEYDVLTARPSRYLRGAPYAYRALVGPINALPALLDGIGYDTFALHPGYPWFYNRQNVYPLLGFEESVFEDAFAPDAYLDTYISEAATFDMLLDMLSARLDGNAARPLFGFCLTIQNHAGYQGRYLPAGTDTFAPTIPLTEAERDTLSNYFYGVIDADTQLTRLAQYLDTRAEPFVLVYFGDHLPALGASLLDKLLPVGDAPEGSLARETRMYQTPFLIWANAAARQLPFWQAARGQADMLMSSNYLGAYLLALLGLDTLDPYWHYAAAMRAHAPVLLESLAFGADGVALPDTDEAVRALRHWVHALPSGS